MANKRVTKGTKRPGSSGKRSASPADATAAKADAPDPASFLDPFDDRTLLAYYHTIAQWHGYIRFLGLPHLRDNPDVPIDRLYVEPSISDSHIQPERSTEDWPETTPVLQAVEASQRLVLLGDPGSGKSTLVSWIAWQLTQPGDNAWTKRLGRLVPIPMILRDMDIGRDITWDGLLEAFLALPVAKPLNKDGKGRERLTDWFQRGQAIIMLDGLDEIGSTAVRQALQAAVFDGFERHAACRWLLTSRIVGYGELPFDKWEPRHRAKEGGPDSLGIRGFIVHADLRYVAPFSDKQIEQFAHNWYIQHEQAEHERQQRARELVDAIACNQGTRHLARIPNLLTLIALIYRIYRWLPHGRAMLYDEIAKAYLESIDRFRGLEGLDYSLAQKKRWLAYVGHQMQLRRSKQEQEDEDSDESEHREILVDEDQVHKWIAEAMGTTVEDADASAKRFVDYIARRSGLLLPRGEGQFAFTHLSLQEYFAACFCLEQVTTPRWLDDRARNAAFTTGDMKSYANDATWRETLTLLFESLAERPDWPDDLVECLYGVEFADLADDPDRMKRDAALLLADVAIDRYAGLSPTCREEALVACWRWELVAERKEGYSTDLHRNAMTQLLLSVASDKRDAIWSAFARVTQGARGRALVETLDLFRTSAVDGDLVHIAGLTGLRTLDLSGTQITDAGLAHLSAMTGLQTLDVSGTQITDAGLALLSAITELEALNLWNTQITDAGLAHLSAMTVLQTLSLPETRITDTGLAHLSTLTGLQRLFLNDTQITDAGLAHISGMTGIKTLNLSETQITDAGLAHLSGLTGLQALFLSNTQITDAGLAHLSRCTKLENVNTFDTTVTEAGKKRFFESLRRGERK